MVADAIISKILEFDRADRHNGGVDKAAGDDEEERRHTTTTAPEAIEATKK